MTRFDRAAENFAARIPTGLAALEEGADVGAPIHYIDATIGEGMIRHFPNGRRDRLARINGKMEVVETLAPGASVLSR